MAKAKPQKINRHTKDMMAIIFLFSLVLGIMLTTYLSNQATGQYTQIMHAAEPQE